MCAGGQVGRLVNALRGFVDIGPDLAVTDANEFFTAFAHSVSGEGLNLTYAQRVAAANALMDTFGMTNAAERLPWLEALADQFQDTN
jgi:hypothetical protein